MSVETILSVVGWPALVFYLLAATTFLDPSQAVKAGFKGALLGIAVLILNLLFILTFGGLPRWIHQFSRSCIEAVSVITTSGLRKCCACRCSSSEAICACI
jgi:hypothetical protein